MKMMTIPVSEKVYELFLKNETLVLEIIEKALEGHLGESSVDRQEFVRVICRAKAPVCNWHDMELQIMKGSL